MFGQICENYEFENYKLQMQVSWQMLIDPNQPQAIKKWFTKFLMFFFCFVFFQEKVWGKAPNIQVWS